MTRRRSGHRCAGEGRHRPILFRAWAVALRSALGLRRSAVGRTEQRGGRAAWEVAVCRRLKLTCRSDRSSGPADLERQFSTQTSGKGLAAATAGIHQKQRQPGRLPRTAGRDPSRTFRQAIEWQVLAGSGLTASECAASTSRRSFIGIATGMQRPKAAVARPQRLQPDSTHSGCNRAARPTRRSPGRARRSELARRRRRGRTGQ